MTKDLKMIFACNCVKCGIKESTGISYFPDGRELCKKCSDGYDRFLLDLYLTNTLGDNKN